MHWSPEDDDDPSKGIVQGECDFCHSAISFAMHVKCS